MYRRISKFIVIAGLTSVTLIGSSSWRESTKAQSERKKDKAPNIVFLIADDMGYSDLSLYGGEIPTPNIEALAKSGMKFTNFHAQAVCSPSRAMIMSGVDNHQAGLGTMAELLGPEQKDKPGYEGYLNKNVVTLAEVLKDGGYHTYMAGKWHLGAKTGYFPSDRGFEQSFALMEGAADNYRDRGFSPTNPKVDYRSNGQAVNLPPNFYSTNFYTDKLIEFIDQNRQDNKPFFALATYTSPHEPLQAPKEDIQMYLGKYDKGWDQIRKERFERMKKLGIIPANVELPPRMDKVPAWDSLSPEEKRYQSKKMAIYAGMIKNLDDNIGRLIDHLKKIGEYDNTIFVFLSDNGAEGNDYSESETYQTWMKKIGVVRSFQCKDVPCVLYLKERPISSMMKMTPLVMR
jgi:arylsulfatase